MTVRFSPRVLLPVLFALPLALPTVARAQKPSFEGGLGVLVGIPQGKFKEQSARAGGGLDGFIGVGLANRSLVLGADLGFMIYGSESRREPFSTTIPDVTVDVSTTNNIALGHLLLRVQPVRGVVEPYLDGLVGFKYLFTTTEIKSQNSQEAVASSNNFDDGAFSYGGGGGLKFRVSEGAKHPQADGKLGPDVFIDLQLRYLAGGEADYLKRGSIRRSGGNQSPSVTFDTQRSRTDLLTIQLGLSAAF